MKNDYLKIIKKPENRTIEISSTYEDEILNLYISDVYTSNEVLLLISLEELNTSLKENGRIDLLDILSIIRINSDSILITKDELVYFKINNDDFEYINKFFKDVIVRFIYD